MSEIKWIKIATGIFDNWKVRQLKSMPSGHEMVCIWFELLCLAGQQNANGTIMFSGKIATTEEILATIFNENLKDIQLALTMFENLGMVEIVEDTICISNWGEYQSAERLEMIRQKDRERKRKKAEEKRLKELSVENSTEIPRNCSISYSNSLSKSYSYSNNSNLDNYMYFIENNKDYSIDSELDVCIRDWLEYKDNRKPKSKNHYDTEKSLKTLINKFVKMSDKYGVEAIKETVDLSIENLYQGIVWDKITSKKVFKSESKSGKVPYSEEWWDEQ